MGRHLRQPVYLFGQKHYLPFFTSGVEVAGKYGITPDLHRLVLILTSISTFFLMILEPSLDIS